jgi:hypothetical protein
MNDKNNNKFDDRITIEVSKKFKNEVKKFCIDNDTSMKDLIINLLVKKINIKKELL